MPRLTLLSAATAQAAPSVATDGKPLFRGATGQVPGEGFDSCNLFDAVVLLHSTAGSGVMTASVRLWGYYEPANKWYPLGPVQAGGTDTNRGLLNNGVTIGEFASPADQLLFSQPIGYLANFSRVAAEIVGALGGTSTAITVVLEAR